MERWILVIFVLALFGGMAVMGWRYRRATPAATVMCGSAQAQCGDRPYLGAP
jgi:hypothetical protein